MSFVARAAAPSEERVAFGAEEATEPDPFVAAIPSDSEPRRIGVLGGTFDPPHIGHLWLAALAADELGLDRVLFMPAAQPPHKRSQPVSRAAYRLQSPRVAITRQPQFELAETELQGALSSYTHQ